MLTIEITVAEADALLKLLDLAVRQGGLSSAEAAVAISKRIRDAAEAMTRAVSHDRELQR
jgi:hypothetical protein